MFVIYAKDKPGFLKSIVISNKPRSPDLILDVHFDNQDYLIFESKSVVREYLDMIQNFLSNEKFYIKEF